MHSKNTVLPPANGKKLWRVKRSTSTSQASHNSAISQTSLECLKNSLQISAATAANGSFSARRPSLKRPKNKPGMPKDFVFVDLSPVKSEISEKEDSPNVITPAMQFPSPPMSVDESTNLFDSPDASETNTSSDNDSVFSSIDNYFFDQTNSSNSVSISNAGLGISLDWNQSGFVVPDFSQQQQQPQPFQPEPPVLEDSLSQQLFGYQKAMIQQYLQIQQLQQQLQEQQRKQLELQTQKIQQEIELSLLSPINSQFTFNQTPKSAKRSNEKKKTAGQFQFKSYTGPKKHGRSGSEASIKKPQRRNQQRSSSVGNFPEQLLTPVSQVSAFGVDETSLQPPISFGLGNSYQPDIFDLSYFDALNNKDLDFSLLQPCGIDQLLLDTQE
ncbi:uncharacterized protein J8A68_002961 [[Candida] subhashii]|uniref:Uncharacterized protein n=1 Tax=[Candida] subhashii TaxID=561895 RepID=A0A8J5QQ78_9ASCO|nr:uncharacterized protein J8A68_002961 [[Candida] subhashii]KAG7663502.1 hypothetical protein J8A68_002961 [[Candida] subhashii]